MEAWHASSLTELEIEAAFRDGAAHKNVLQLRASVARTLAPYPDKKKLLLFAAFGNGNLGDAIQPTIIAGDLEAHFDVVVFSFSEMDVLSYPFPVDRKLTARPDLDVAFGPLNPHILDLFDGLIIGGGGLLACPHSPVWDPHWPHSIPIPYVVWACGIANPIPNEVVNLVRLAEAASGRDARSVEAITQVRPEALLCPDPVLATLQLQQDAGHEGRAFILRGPIRDGHLSVRDSIRSEDVVIGVEPATDWPLIDIFPDIRFVTSMEALTRLLSKRAYVVSERYHGVIAALLMGKAVYGLTRPDHNESKIVELYRSIDAPSYCGQEWKPSTEPFPYETVTQFIASCRARYQSTSDSLVRALFASNKKSKEHLHKIESE